MPATTPPRMAPAAPPIIAPAAVCPCSGCSSRTSLISVRGNTSLLLNEPRLRLHERSVSVTLTSSHSGLPRWPSRLILMVDPGAIFPTTSQSLVCAFNSHAALQRTTKTCSNFVSFTLR